jgi:predicted RNA-binding Zn-ribbon protein involved in translation (DUF1610 family)
MPRDNDIVRERIAKNLCPICGEKLIGKTILVMDAVFGDVLVCDRHIVQGENKLKE